MVNEITMDNRTSSRSPGFMIRRISWGAVFAGVVIGLGVNVLLNLLGIGLGAGAIDPLQETQPAEGIGIAAGIWYLCVMLIASFIGGYIASRLAGPSRKGDGMLHGLITWGFTTLLSVYLITTAASNLMGMTANLVGRSVSAIGQGVTAAAPAVTDALRGGEAGDTGILDTIRTEAQELFNQGASPDATATENPIDVFNRIIRSPGQQLSADERQSVIDLLVARANMSPDQAATTVDRWQQNILDARAQLNQLGDNAAETARVAADRAATFTSRAALWSFAGLLLAGLAAGFGGWTGTPRMYRDDDRDSTLDRTYDDTTYPTGRAS